MGILNVIMQVALIFVSLLLIGVILLQRNKGAGAGVSFGMGEAVFGADMGNVLTRTTIVLGVIFLLLVLGLFCSTLAYAGYNYGVRNLGASEACIFNNAIPIFSLIAALLIGQETFSWGKLAGMCIVIAGVVISQIPAKKK